MSTSAQEITTSDGRTIEFATLGDSSHPTLFVHHGSPGSVGIVDAFASFASDFGLFVVATSRAGYGRTSRLAGRNVADVVADVHAVLDHLGRDTYVTLGWSGGGPHALACAALDASRCRGAWSIAGVVPVDVDFDWTEGMGPENVEEFAVAMAGGPEYEAHMVKMGEDFAAITPDTLIELFGGLLPDVDKVAWSPLDAREQAATMIAHGFSRGHFGFYDDDRAFLTPWGFDPRDITVPVYCWYGDRDLMVPPTHGNWLVANLATAHQRHYADEGHISIVSNHLGELGAEISSAAAALLQSP